MRHLQPAIIGFELAGDQSPAALRQEALQIGGIGLEIDELERARGILHQHAIGRSRAPARPPGRCSATVTSSVASSPMRASAIRGVSWRSMTPTGRCQRRSITRACGRAMARAPRACSTGLRSWARRHSGSGPARTERRRGWPHRLSRASLGVGSSTRLDARA